jgi:hypothetical protein
MPKCTNCQGDGFVVYYEDGRQVQDVCYHCGTTGFVSEEQDARDTITQRIEKIACDNVARWRAARDNDPECENWAFCAAERARERVLELTLHGRGQDVPGIAGTGYAGFNAMVEYVNYEKVSRGKTDDERQAGRYHSTLFGSGRDTIKRGIVVLNDLMKRNSIQI